MEKVCKHAFFLLPLIILSSIVMVLLMLMFRTLYHYNQLTIMQEKQQALFFATQSLALWAVVNVKADFDHFYKKIQFLKNIEQWPPGKLSGYHGLVKVEAVGEHTLLVQASLELDTQKDTISYKVTRIPGVADKGKDSYRMVMF